MKNKLSSAIIWIAFFSVCVSASSEENSNAQTKPSSVEIFFVPDGLSYITRIDEGVLKKIGCQYILSDATISNNLLIYLTNARENIAEKIHSITDFEKRNMLVFHFENKKDLVVSYSQKFSNLSYLRGSWNGEPVQLRVGLSGQVGGVIDHEKLRQLNDKAPQYCGSK